MTLLSKYAGEDLIIIQPFFFKREYEFRTSREVLARMYFPKFFSRSAIVEGFAEKYEIFKPDFWKSDIAIRKFGHDMSFAFLTSNFFRTKGIIDLQNGKKIQLKFGSFKKSCQVFSELEELLVLFQNKLSIKDKILVTIQQPSDIIDENPWVVMLILFMILQNSRRSGSAV